MASRKIATNKRSRPLHPASSSRLSFHSARESHTGFLLPVASSVDHVIEPSSQQQLDRIVGGNEEEESDAFLDKHSSLFILAIFLSYIILLYLVYLSFPTMSTEERKHMKLPLSMTEAKNLAAVLDRYTANHYWTVLSGFTLAYLFLQTFAIPGSIFLSIMSGFLFPFWTALFVICICSASGASCCYMLSWLVGRSLVEEHFPQVIQRWRGRVEEERENLLNFIIFLRITPILPNSLINIVAPHIGVPLKPFWIGTFIGVAPPSALAAQAGVTLNMMTSPTDHISWSSIIVLAFIALLTLIPVVIRRLQAH